MRKSRSHLMRENLMIWNEMPSAITILPSYYPSLNTVSKCLSSESYGIGICLTHDKVMSFTIISQSET